jgi:hypothetical protein
MTLWAAFTFEQKLQAIFPYGKDPFQEKKASTSLLPIRHPLQSHHQYLLRVCTRCKTKQQFRKRLKTLNYDEHYASIGGR